MRHIRSVLLTIAAFIGGFVATQLVIYGLFCLVAWRSGRAAESIAYAFMGGQIVIGVPVSLGVGVLAGSVVRRNRASMTP